jgi:septal ring factor EnvC (AmiA/AmiB activator)
MKRIYTLIIATSAMILGIALSHLIFAQASKKDQLQNQRDEITKKIKETKALIAESEKNQKLTAGQISVLNEQIQYREKMISNIDQEMSSIDETIEHENEQIADLSNQLESLKKEYATMIYQAYKNRSSYNQIVFILASSDFYQAYKRFKLMQSLSETRKTQVTLIHDTESRLNEKISAMMRSKEQVATLKKEQENEKAEINQDKLAQQNKLLSLKKESSKLREQQKKQEGDRKKLSSKIQDIINQELAAERKREQEKANKAAELVKIANANKNKKVETPKISNGAGNTEAKTEKKTEAKITKIELAPEVVSMNSNFENNKGNLPWPVAHGAITSRFGKHNHPTLNDIVLNNNGLDFTTKVGEPVICVFSGNVTSVFSIPGAGYNIIVTHGTYKTVYSGLAQVNVKVGDKVSTKQTLGTVAMGDEEAVLHFELWAVSSVKGTAQNPESWIKRK